MSKFEAFAEDLGRNYVIRVGYKDKSWLMKFLGLLMFFNRGFMTHYITTIGNTVYFPNEDFIKKNELGAITVLAHEVVHIAQKEKRGFALFAFEYLFPQCLTIFALLTLLAFVWLPFLWCLLFLLFLAPIPAPWRKKFEVEGYTMTLYMSDLIMRQIGHDDDYILKELSLSAVRIDRLNFRGSGYWYMWPWGVDEEFAKKIEDIRSGVISDTDEVYGRVRRSYLNAVSAYEL